MSLDRFENSFSKNQKTSHKLYFQHLNFNWWLFSRAYQIMINLPKNRLYLLQDITNCFKISVLHIPRVTLTLRYTINFIENKMTRNYTSTLWVLEHRGSPCWLFVGIYITAVTSQERLLFKKNFFGLKKCGFYSREVTKRERLLMARVR